MRTALANDPRLAHNTRTGRKPRGHPESEGDLRLARVHRIVGLLRLATAPSRQDLVLLLSRGEQFVGALRDALGSPSQPAVSHQLALLRHGGLIESERRGRRVFYRLTESGAAVARVLALLAASQAFGRDGPTHRARLADSTSSR